MRAFGLAILASIAVLVLACSDDPTDPGPPAGLTHPEGIIDSLILVGRPYGVALLPDKHGADYAGRPQPGRD